MIFQNSIYDGATYTATSEFRNTQVKSTASYTHQRQHLDPYLTRGDSNYMWGEICTSRASYHVTCQHMVELRKSQQIVTDQTERSIWNYQIKGLQFARTTATVIPHHQ